MVIKASVVMLSGTQLLGTARSRTVVTDRPLDEGGTDVGFTSGEMLLLAIGSCASSGGLRRHFAEKAYPAATSAPMSDSTRRPLPDAATASSST